MWAGGSHGGVGGDVDASLPDPVSRHRPQLLDGSALLPVFLPACSLAGTVAVVGELTLATAVQLGLLAETAVAHLGGKTGQKERPRRGHVRWRTVLKVTQVTLLTPNQNPWTGGAPLLHHVTRCFR